MGCGASSAKPARTVAVQPPPGTPQGAAWSGAAESEREAGPAEGAAVAGGGPSESDADGAAGAPAAVAGGDPGESDADGAAGAPAGVAGGDPGESDADGAAGAPAAVAGGDPGDSDAASAPGPESATEVVADPVEAKDKGDDAGKDGKDEGMVWEIRFDTKPRRGKKKKGRPKAKARDLAVVDADNDDEAQTADGVVVMETDPALAIPKGTEIDYEKIAARHVLDHRRWVCVSRPQYKYSCGMSSLTSAWNFLYSRLGHGTMEPFTQEEIMDQLGFKPPFREIRFGPFTGNVTIMRWFHKLCRKHNVPGRASFLWKPHGAGRTIGVSPDRARELVCEALQSESQALIGHIHNHYWSWIGYECTPGKAVEAYANEPADLDMWLLAGDSSRTSRSIASLKWAWVVKDLTSQRPDFFNLRKPHLGLQTKNTKRKGGNMHCIMVFRKDVPLAQDLAEFEVDDDEDEEVMSEDGDDEGTTAQEGADEGAPSGPDDVPADEGAPSGPDDAADADEGADEGAPEAEDQDQGSSHR